MQHILHAHSIVPFFGAIISFTLGIFVLSRNSRNEINRSFCFLALTLSFFNFKVFLLQQAPTPHMAVFWMKIFHGGNVFTYSTCYHFILALTNDHRRFARNFLKFAYASSVLLLLAVWLESPVPVALGTIVNNGVVSPVINKNYNLIFFSLFLAYFIVDFVLLLKKFRSTTNALEKNRIGLVFVGVFIGFTTGIPNFLIVSQTVKTYPTGYIGSIAAALCFAYAIVKYQLMDIEIVLHHGTVYTLVTAAVTGCFLSGLFVFQLLFEKISGQGSKIPTILTIWLISFLFQPIRIGIQRLVDNVFFRHRLDFQHIISKFSAMVVTIMDRAELAGSAVSILEKTFQATSVSLMLLRQSGHKKYYYMEACSGLSSIQAKDITFREDDPFLDYLKNHKSWIIRDALENNFTLNNSKTEKEVVKAMQKIDAAIVFPLYWGEDKLVGVLGLGEKRATSIYNIDEINIISILCNEAALAFENANLYDEAKRHLASAIEALAAVVEAKDSYTFGHCHRVINHAIAVGRRLNLPDEKIEALRLGATLHDIGKIGISKNILCKPGKLTQQEFTVITTHTELGAGILRPLNLPKDVTDGVKYHHERYDGDGYPCGLKGEQIPLVARIISIADVFEALTSDRVYRKGMTKEDALKIMDSQKGRSFDPKLLDIFVSLLN